MLDSNKELYEAIEGLLNIVQNKEEDVAFRSTFESVKEAYVNKCSDPLAKTILNDLTRFSAKLIIYELLQPSNNSDTFQSTTESCTCPHWFSFKLPCRHIMECKRNAGNF